MNTGTDKNHFTMRKLIILFILILSACFEQKEDFYFQGLFVEFNEVSLAPSPATFFIPMDDGAGTISVQVNLVGAHQDADQSIAFSVAPESTAQPEKHYHLAGGAFTIPAASSFGYIELTILDGDIPAGESVELSLILEGNDHIRPSENYKEQRYVIYGGR